MTTKRELVAVAEGMKELIPQAGVQAVALLSDEDFEARLDMMKRGRERIERVQREYMVLDQDFGLIPNTPKPTLFKPGAEKLAQLYGLAARIESQFISGDNATTPPLMYDSQCFLHLGNFDGPIMGVGHGTANSWEKRYRREGAKVCPNCGKPALIKSKAEYGGGWYCFPKKDGCGSKFGTDDPNITGQATDAKGDAADQWDLGVTLMKMAEKRSFVDAVLRATATSGLFTQDMAEDPPEYRNTDSGAQRPSGGAVVRIQRDADTAEAQDADDLMDAILASTGGEEIVVSPTQTGQAGRGGRTASANTAQIEEVRRLAGQMRWGAKRILTFGNTVFGSDMAIPDDPADAKAELETWLEGLSSAGIGQIVTAMREESSVPF